ncbi:hypothetical protein [Marinomonas sp. THO17]|uniref:hypothetical protein n=1 Tax=Marinomonas sp. THO17 TaxID=3149048 RepID=UPI00336BD53F
MADNTFSTTQKVGDSITPCQQGNVFAAYCPQGGPTLSALVNGQETQIPQMGPLVKNGLSLPQTTGALELKVDNQCRTIIPDLAEFEISKPEEVGIAIGVLEKKPAPVKTDYKFTAKGRQINYGTLAENKVQSDDIYNLAIPPALQALAPKEGTIDIENADEDTIRWMAVSIVTVLGRIDEITGAQALANATNKNVDFTLLGTNAVPLAIELIDMLKSKGNRAFLREIFKDQTQLSKVWTNAAGKLMVSFRGYAGLRSFLNLSSYGVSNTKVSIISSAVRNSQNWAGTLKSVGGRIPIISYVIVGAIDVVEWLALPEAEQDFSDLLAVLFVDISKIAISVIAGTTFAALTIALITTAPVWLIIGVGVGASVLAGMVLDSVDNAFGITEKIKDLANKLEGPIDSFIESMMEGVASVEEFITHANPGDGEVTGPMDYLMEIDTGIRQYIYDRLRWP